MHIVFFDRQRVTLGKAQRSEGEAKEGEQGSHEGLVCQARYKGDFGMFGADSAGLPTGLCIEIRGAIL